MLITIPELLDLFPDNDRSLFKAIQSGNHCFRQMFTAKIEHPQD